jgi:hypothetical protein
MPKLTVWFEDKRQQLERILELLYGAYNWLLTYGVKITYKKGKTFLDLSISQERKASNST